MSGVYINDFKIPKNCGECPFLDYEQGECFAKRGSYVKWGNRAVRQAWCPLAPAADVVPVRHGRWNWIGFNIECSECGHMPYFECTEMPNYCPNCGALMDKDGDGE